MIFKWTVGKQFYDFQIIKHREYFIFTSFDIIVYETLHNIDYDAHIFHVKCYKYCRQRYFINQSSYDWCIKSLNCFPDALNKKKWVCNAVCLILSRHITRVKMNYYLIFLQITFQNRIHRDQNVNHKRCFTCFNHIRIILYEINLLDPYVVSSSLVILDVTWTIAEICHKNSMQIGALYKLLVKSRHAERS